MNYTLKEQLSDMEKSLDAEYRLTLVRPEQWVISIFSVRVCSDNKDNMGHI